MLGRRHEQDKLAAYQTLTLRLETVYRGAVRTVHLNRIFLRDQRRSSRHTTNWYTSRPSRRPDAGSIYQEMMSLAQRVTSMVLVPAAVRSGASR